MEPNGLLITLADMRFEIVRSGSTLSVNGHNVDARLTHITGSTYSLLLEGRGHEVVLTENGVYVDGWHVHVDVKTSRSRLLDRFKTSNDAQTSAISMLKAPMPGLVLQITVAPGDTVEHEQSIMVLEAMKMENELRAPCSGIVTCVHAEVGDAVAKQALLMEITPTAATVTGSTR